MPLFTEQSNVHLKRVFLYSNPYTVFGKCYAKYLNKILVVIMRYR